MNSFMISSLAPAWLRRVVAIAACAPLLSPLQGTAVEVEGAPLVAQIRAPESNAMVEGEVRKIDKEMSKLTIKHGELKNLGMPAMTMVFRVKDPEILDRVSVGDHVRFIADSTKGSLVVTKLEIMK